MFNDDFYPTPNSIINQMLIEVGVQGKIVLEPSAGKGNIVDILNQRGASQVLTYEKEKVLADHLKNKSEFLGFDFLKECTAEDISHVDLIIMNPPFSQVENHILHAWEIAPEGCQIIALCPTSRFDRGYMGRRQELKALFNNFGFGKTDLGDCFSTAERKTDVDVSLINLLKPIRSDSFDYEGFYMDMPEELDYPDGVIKYDFVRSVVSQYVTAMKIFDRFSGLAEEMDTAITPLGFDRGCELKFGYDDSARTKQEFSRTLQKSGWQKIFAKLNMRKYVTSGVMEDINRFVEKRREYPFTRENIYRMLEIIVGTQDDIMERAMEEAFDKITKHYDKNRYHVEGWKTNSHYLVNQKFILPYMVEEGFRGGLTFCYNGYTDKLDDLNKALCYLTGKQNNLGSIRSLPKNLPGGEIQRSTWYDWGFLKVKFYNKGTVHAKFKDEKVWELFNQRVAKIKGYPLPENVDLAA